NRDRQKIKLRSAGALSGLARPRRPDVRERKWSIPTRRVHLGASSYGMPPPWVFEASDGILVLYNGITAAPIAKLASRTTIRVEVVGKLRRAYAGEPKIGDRLR